MTNKTVDAQKALEDIEHFITECGQHFIPRLLTSDPARIDHQEAVDGIEIIRAALQAAPQTDTYTPLQLEALKDAVWNATDGTGYDRMGFDRAFKGLVELGHLTVQKPEAARDEHCKDCCCAKAWQALGITEYTGKSIPEHIAELKPPGVHLTADEAGKVKDALRAITDEVKLKGYHPELEHFGPYVIDAEEALTILAKAGRE